MSDDPLDREIDFSKGVRGKFYRPGMQIHIPVYLEQTVWDSLTEIAERKGIRSAAQGARNSGDAPMRASKPDVDVRRVRERLKLSQNEFAAKFGFSPAVVRNWKQGRNRPAGAARILLAVIERHPEAVEDAIR